MGSDYVDQILLPIEQWYQKNARTLPWRRKKKNPYEVWISEVMSQQSVLKTVVQYFEAWMKKFPNIKSLADASEDEVLSQWAGLGYYSRARSVHKASKLLYKDIVEHEEWPQTPEEWKVFPGVGPYTSKAISAIVYNVPVIPMDGNVIRVLSRFFQIEDPLNNKEEQKQLTDKIQVLEKALKQSKCRAENIAQGFMDLGATVCRPGQQFKCELCPLQAHCKAHQNGMAATIPQKKLRPKSVELFYVAKVFRRPEAQIWVEPVPDEFPGSLVGQWQVPLSRLEKAPQNSDAPHKKPLRHAITRHKISVWVQEEADPGASRLSARGQWVDPAETEVHLSTLSRKILSILS